jgi:natural product precursor
MKKLGKLRLTQLNKDELEKRQMSALKGGVTCGCICVPGGGNYATEYNVNNQYKKYND